MKRTLIGAGIFVVLYNILFFHMQLGLGITVFFFLLNTYFFFIRNRKAPNMTRGFISSACAVLFSGLFVLRSNNFVQFLNFSAAVFFSFAALYVYKLPEAFSPRLFSFIFLPLVVIRDSLRSMMSYNQQFSNSAKGIQKDISASLIRGIVITVPIIIILFLLLAKADPAFAKITKNFIDTLGERFIVSVILGCSLIVAGLAQFIKKSSADKKQYIISPGLPYELAIISGSMIVLFGLFIAIQFRYLFSAVGERELHQLGIASLTYSEYVRRGFFELLIAGIISGSVILYILQVLHKLQDKKRLLIQCFSGLLTIETAIILFSDVKRLFLYANAHGLTNARIFGFIFLLWLALLLIIFFFRIIKERSDKWFFSTTIIITLLAMISTTIIPVDDLISTKYPPTVNNDVDYSHIAGLSVDAGNSWLSLLDHVEEKTITLEKIKKFSDNDYAKFYVTSDMLWGLSDNVRYLINKYGTAEEIVIWNMGHKNRWTMQKDGWVDQLKKTNNLAVLPYYLKDARKWQSWNYSEYQAYTLVHKNFALFKKLLLLEVRLNQIRQKIENSY